eukprot:CAMPEP_0117687630 /NCGR_PEP_ID=MMETSP0804-20121206/23255_1 /TAXON_ID=1074897 /ORGANISM="Tetraselmis astigmatica, Strain CCMP880" /LENGTH=121 /DNA_ID=CAMNT_0005499741 /DNA_START=905 /DNA_END=1267 /DNA_ORIENTATION=+
MPLPQQAPSLARPSSSPSSAPRPQAHPNQAGRQGQVRRPPLAARRLSPSPPLPERPDALRCHPRSPTGCPPTQGIPEKPPSAFDPLPAPFPYDSSGSVRASARSSDTRILTDRYGQPVNAW